MKKINLIEWLFRNSHEKQKPQRFGRYAVMLIMLLTLGVGQARAWFTIMDEDIYFDATDQYSTWSLNSNNLYVKIYYGGGTETTNVYQMTQITGSKLYHCGSARKHGNVSGIEFFAGPNSSTYTYYTSQISFNGWSNALDNIDRMCYTNGNSWDQNISCPPLSTISLAKYSTTTYGGDGSVGDPYLVAVGTSAQVQVSSTKETTNITAKYKFTVGESTDGDYTTTTTKQVVASAVNGTTYTASVQGWGYGDSKYSYRGLTSNTVHFQGVNIYSVTYNANSAGSGSVPAVSGTYYASGKNVTLATNTGSLAMTGYSLTGWNTEADGSGDHYALGGTYNSISGDVELYAEWTPDWALYNSSTKLADFTKVNDYEYTLSYDMNVTTHTNLQFKHNGTGYIAGADNPTSTFRALTGNNAYFNWSVVNGVTTGSYIITIKSTDSGSSWSYKAEQKYILTYDANGATSGSAPTDANSPYAPNTAVTTASSSMTKTSFTLTGWNTKADGSGTHYNLNTSNAFNINSNMTLYAEWTPDVPASACVAGNFGTATTTKTIDGSVTTFTYTFYDKAAGTYDFYLDNCSGSAVLKATTGITMSQTGCTSIANSGDANNYFRVVTGSAGDFTITATYNTSTKTIHMDVTRVDIDAVTPSWYMIGDEALFSNWNTNNYSYPLNRSYRGVSNVTYRVVDFKGYDDKYFKPLKGTSRYGHTGGGGNQTVATGMQYSITATDAEGTAFKANGQGIIWCVVDETNSKFWVQNPTTYYTITLANGTSGNVLVGTQGTVALTENSYGNLATKQYASGERVNISITAASGYKINNITLGETSVATGVDETTYSGYTTMPSGNATLTVTYTPIDYTITLNKNGGADNGSVTATYNSKDTKSFTAVTRTGYNCTGYWTATSDGTKVVNADGSLVEYTSAVSSYLNTNGTWKKTTATTLYAQWTPKTYAITLDKKEGGADGTASVNYNATALTSISAPTKTGYHVEGYYGETGRTNKVADASGNLQSGVSGFTTGTVWTKDADATLYTKWEANTFTVEFDANGGEGDMSDQVFTYDAAQNLTTNTFTNDGYFFDGWATEVDGAVVHTNGKSVSNLTTENGGTVTLYAHWSQVPALSSVTATPASYNYVDEDITLNLSATSTYLEHPIVVFFVNDGIGTCQVTAAAYGDGDDVVGTIGSDAAYTTVHKATFAVKAAGTYSVTAKLYEGELVDNFEGTNAKGWAGDNLGDGSITFGANNPGRMAGNGSSKVLEVTRTSGEEWGGAIMVLVDNSDDKDDCDATGSNDYAYIHALMKDATAATHLKNNDNSSDSNNADIEPSFTGDASADWRHVTYHNTHCSNNFLFFMIQRGDTENKTLYIDDVILSNNSTWAPVKDEEDEDVTAAASPVVINQTYDISIIGGRVAFDNSETSVKASADVTNPLVGTADVIGVDVPLGMKFVGWKLSTGISLKDGYELTDHAIQFYALGNGTVTAQYEKRNRVNVYFAAVPGWDNVYAYVWQNSNTSNKNATYPGEELTVTSEYDGITYYYYGYYTEGTGLGDAAPGDAAWDRVIFNKGAGSTTAYPTANWNKTKDLELVNGHFYHFADDESGSEYYYDWYVMGRWNGAATWNYTNPIDYTNTAIVRDLNTEKQSFKIYRASTNEWFKYDPDGDSADEEDAAVIGSAMTLSKGVANNNIFTPDTKAGYEFSLVKDNTSPTLTIQKMTDQDISVTVEAGANGSITTGTSIIHLYTTTTIEAAANAGYRFKKWTVDDAHKSYIHIEDTTSASTKVYAKYGSLGNGATITAHFGNDNMIYCDRSGATDWSGDKVYVCLYSSEYFDDSKGTGASGSQCFVKTVEMTQIGTSGVYYYDYSGSGHTDGSDGNPNFNRVAFTDHYAPSADNFASMCLTYRADFYPSAGRLFVLENFKEFNKNGSAAYYVGYWMKYREEEAGIKLKLYDGSNQLLYGCPFTFTHENVDTRTFTTTVKLNGGSTYRIELLGDNGIYYKNNGTYNTTHAGTYWQYKEREATVGYITTTGEGDYTFTLDCSSQLKMATAYPLKAGDYRIVYNGKTYVGDEDAGDFYGSPLAQWSSDTKIDKVSFFVTDESGSGMEWNLRVQSCSIAGSTVTWNDVAGKVFSFSDLDGKTGVYVFDVKQTSASDITIENPVKYTGDYYIRTDIADGRWEAYKEAENNKMVYSEWAEKHSDYNYYHCHYTPNGKSVKFTIANDYSSSISGELVSDDYTTGDGKLSANANVRFSYNSATNVIKRTYIGGSADDTYLNIVSPTPAYVYASNGTTDLNGASAYTRKFVDMGNWVYQLDVQAYPTSQARVTAYYNGDTQYLIGSSTTSETIIGGAAKGTKKYKLRIVYDFKNNHLISSWLADGNEIGENITLNADLMIVRHLQEAGVQITFDNSTHSVSGIKTIYGAIRFDYNDMVNQMPNWNALGIYGKVIYFISFPFDVNVKDIFGSAGNIEDQWIIQSYNGARRAKEGWFADSKPFWETLTVDSVMKAGRGYALIIDRPSFNDPSSVVWTNKSAGSSVYLYFPSHNADAATIGIGTKTITVPAHKCEIERSFYNSSSVLVSHTQTDSHWNMMGVPLFENKTASTVVEDDDIYEDIPLYYFYDWNAATNTYDVMSTGVTPFKAMHGYMVQFAGDVTFSGAALNPSAIVAAHHVADKKKYRVELQMTNENGILSRTYVELRVNACDTFLLNEDVYMMRSSTTVDLFTLAGNYDVAANVLPIQNHTIPVGMDVKQAGMYTFSMPSNFSGTVTLLDTQAGTRTNLALEDYQVYLNQGPINGRFYLVLDIQESTTSLEEITGEGSIKDGGVHKFLKGGQMFILKNGVIYDAKGNRVK